MSPLCKVATRKFLGNSDGSAIVEFAFLAPVMLLMMLGVVELGRAIAINRNFGSAIQTASDLVSREEYLGKTASDAVSNLGGMMASVKQLMAPYDSATLRASVYSVQAS